MQLVIRLPRPSLAARRLFVPVPPAASSRLPLRPDSRLISSTFSAAALAVLPPSDALYRHAVPTARPLAANT